MTSISKFLYLMLVCLSLGACSTQRAFFLDLEGQNKGVAQDVAQTSATETKPSTSSESRTVEVLAGSEVKGSTISSTDNSLACTLKNWNLKGIFDDKKMITTEGEFVFEATNRGQEDQRFILVELLAKDKQGQVLKFSNPFRELQGHLLEVRPPLKSDQTKEVKLMKKYILGLHEVELKTCRHLASANQYFEVYPELKDYPAP
jgi:hypothetical protein